MYIYNIHILCRYICSIHTYLDLPRTKRHIWKIQVYIHTHTIFIYIYTTITPKLVSTPIFFPKLCHVQESWSRVGGVGGLRAHGFGEWWDHPCPRKGCVPGKFCEWVCDLFGMVIYITSGWLPRSNPGPWLPAIAMLVLPEGKWPLKWWAKRDQRPTFGGSSVRLVVWRLKDHLVDLFCFFWGRELVDVGGKSPCGPWVWENNPHHIIPDECLDLNISDMQKNYCQSLTEWFHLKRMGFQILEFSFPEKLIFRWSMS